LTRYAGADISLAGTALVSLSESGDVIHVINGLGYPVPDGSFWTKYTERIEIISRGVVSFLRNTTSAIEGYSYGSKGKSVTDIAELGGVIRYEIAHNINRDEWEVAPEIIPPTSLKRFTTGSGKADKAKMAIFVYKKWGFEHDDHNVIDAYALAQMIRYSKEKPDMTHYQKESLVKSKMWK